MTVKLSSLKADLDRELKGDWVSFPDLDGVRFNVSSIMTPAYTIARDLAFQKLARKYGKKPVPANVRMRVIGKLFCEHLLHDWDGLDEKYSPEKALETLTDPAYRVLVGAVEWCASALSDVQVEFVEDDEKNSDAPSDDE